MKKRHVVVSAEALADLDATFKFISEDSPVAALRIVGKLEEAAADLRTTALHYPIVVQRSGVPVRRRVVGFYNILFWVTEDTVGVLRFLHGKRRIFTDSEAN